MLKYKLMHNKFKTGLLGTMILICFGMQGFAQQSSKIFVPYRMGNLWGYSDTSGKILIKPRFAEVFPFDGLYGMVRENGICKWIDRKGEVHDKMFGGEPDCEEYEDFGHVVEDITGLENVAGKYGRADSVSYSIPFIYENFKSSGIENRFALMKNGLWGVVDRKNKTLVPFKYSDMLVLDESHFLAKNDSAYGVIDITGRITVPFTYDGIKDFDGKILIARKGDYWGYVNAKGRQITAFKYAACKPFVKGLAIVTLPNEQIGYIDMRGREYWKEL